MSPLPAALSGYVLPYKHYGSHLKNGKTIDNVLEVQNFAHAGETLAEIWSALKIDGIEVRASYVHPSDTVVKPGRMNFDWIHRHVRFSQYLIQIVKCTDVKCCGKWKSTYY